jgi:hypothetical protein
MAKKCKPCRKAKKGKKRKPSAWNKHVMKEFRKNKSGGFSAALRRAAKTYRKGK